MSRPVESWRIRLWKEARGKVWDVLDTMTCDKLSMRVLSAVVGWVGSSTSSIPMAISVKIR